MAAAAFAPVSTGILVPASAADQYPTSFDDTFKQTLIRTVDGFDEQQYRERYADCELDEHTQEVRSRRPAVWRRLHFIQTTRVHLTMAWVVYFSILMLRAGAWTNAWRSARDLMSRLRTEIYEIGRIGASTGAATTTTSTGVSEMRR